MIPADRNCGENVFLVARNHDADRNLAIIGAVGGIEGATARVEANLSTQVATERSFKRGNVKRVRSVRWSNVLRHKEQSNLRGCKARTQADYASLDSRTTPWD